MPNLPRLLDIDGFPEEYKKDVRDQPRGGTSILSAAVFWLIHHNSTIDTTHVYTGHNIQRALLRAGMTLTTRQATNSLWNVASSSRVTSDYMDKVSQGIYRWDPKGLAPEFVTVEPHRRPTADPAALQRHLLGEPTRVPAAVRVEEPEETPVTVDNNGAVRLEVGIQLKVVGYMEDETILADTTGQLYTVTVL